MSNNISAENAAIPVIHFKIIDKNNKISIDVKESLDTILNHHNLSSLSHPYFSESFKEFSEFTNSKISLIEDALEELDLRCQGLDGNITAVSMGNNERNLSVKAPQDDDHAVNKAYLEECCVNIDADNFSTTGLNYLSGIGFPSGALQDLTLGASNSTYIAPFNCYYILSKAVTANFQYVILQNTNTLYTSKGVGDTTNQTTAYCVVPALAGEQVRVIYNAAGATNKFGIIPAKGAI